MKKIKLYEAFIGEAFEVHYSDGIRGMQKFGDKNKAISYMKDKIATNKNLKDIAVYNAGSGFHSTADVDAVISWWGDGSYLDNVSKKDNKLAAKKLDESLVTEGQFSWMTQDTGNQIGSEKENTIAVTMFDDKGNKWLERKYDGYGEFGGKDYYELLAQMNGVENADRQDGIDIAFGKMKIKGDVLFPALIEEPNRFNFKRHDFTQEPENDPNQSWYQEPEYDDDDDYDEYDESKVTEAKALPLDKLTKMIGDKPSCYSLADFVYTNYDKVTGLKKSMRNDEMDFPSEIMDLVDHYGFDVDDFTDKYSMAAESLNVDEKEVNLFDEVGPELEALRSKISGLMKKSEDDKWTSALGKALTALSTLDRNLSQADSKLGVVPVNEASMSDIDLMAQEAKDFKSFVKEFTKEYHDLSNAGEPGQFKEWLQSVYDNAKANMDESVVTEGKHWHVLSGNTWYTGSDFSTNPADAMKYDDIMSATKVAKKVGGMVHVMTDEEMTKAIKKFGKNESKVTEAVAPAGLTKAETKKVAETYAKAISKHDGVKCTVNAKSLEEDSFDLDIDGEEYAGGSYMITLDGDVINAALPEKPVYGQIDSTVDQIIKNLKK
jgi:hypothetical protein